MKLSTLTFDAICTILGRSDFFMHFDDSDALRCVACESTFKEICEQLTIVYGDVDIVLDPQGFWSSKVTINDKAWKDAHEKYCAAKMAWCNKYGCD